MRRLTVCYHHLLQSIITEDVQGTAKIGQGKDK